MNFTLIDFFIGFFLMNAMPHLLSGLFRVRFISLFGYSPQGNIGYAFFNVAVALLLFHIEYDIGTLAGNGIMLGALAMLVIYLVTGRFFHELFRQK